MRFLLVLLIAISIVSCKSEISERGISKTDLKTFVPGATYLLDLSYQEEYAAFDMCTGFYMDIRDTSKMLYLSRRDLEKHHKRFLMPLSTIEEKGIKYKLVINNDTVMNSDKSTYKASFTFPGYGTISINHNGEKECDPRLEPYAKYWLKRKPSTGFIEK